MRVRPTIRSFPLPALLVALGAAACTSTSTSGDVGGTAPPPPPRLTTEPWTEAFEAPAVLVARRIEVRGPDRLADRFVAVQDPGNVDVSVETTSAGLLQTYRVVVPGASARGQLDAWQLAATEELVVLQEPGRVDVRIEARGDAFFQPADASQGQRAPALDFRGPVAWPEPQR